MASPLADHLVYQTAVRLVDRMVCSWADSSVDHSAVMKALHWVVSLAKPRVDLSVDSSKDGSTAELTAAWWDDQMAGQKAGE